MGNWRSCWKNFRTVNGLRKGQNPRLQFTDAEREDSRLKEHIRHADQAADKAEAARAKISRKRKRSSSAPLTLPLGKRKPSSASRKWISPPGLQAHPCGNSSSGQDHFLPGTQENQGKPREDNVGVQSVHQVEEAAESGVHMAQSAYRSHKLRLYRAAAAERKLEKANVNALYQKSLAENPAFPATPFPAGSKSRLSRNSMPPPSVPVRVLMQRQRLRRIPPKPRKKPPRKPKRPGASSGGIAGASVLSLRCFLWCVPLQTAFPPVRCCFRGGLSGVAGSTYPLPG